MSGVSGGRDGTGLPGEVGLWVFIFADLAFFLLLFALAARDLGHARAAAEAGRDALTPAVGVANTLILLTGSWATAIGTRVVPRDRAPPWLYAAAASGVVFLALKVVEYAHVTGAGHALGESAFFTWYFFLTGFHAFHVGGGIVLLATVAARLRQGQEPGEPLIEAAGCYWHLVDLLWIAIFLLLYLL
jgi:nitric oxide reductase NorE protein